MSRTTALPEARPDWAGWKWPVTPLRGNNPFPIASSKPFTIKYRSGDRRRYQFGQTSTACLRHFFALRHPFKIFPLITPEAINVMAPLIQQGVFQRGQSEGGAHASNTWRALCEIWCRTGPQIGRSMAPPRARFNRTKIPKKETPPG